MRAVAIFKSPARRWGGALALAAALLGVPAAGAAPSPPPSALDHRHADYARLLAAHVRGGRVDYAGLKSDAEALNRYLDQLAAVTEYEFNSWVIPQRLAFLVNLHNATVLRMVCRRYPVGRFSRVAGWFRDPFHQPEVRLFGSRLSLAVLRDNIIRKPYGEPGVHFGLTPAARGAPPLRNEPYVPERLQAQLEDQLRLFLADETCNRIDEASGRLYLSTLFRDYEEDFIRRAGSLRVYLRPFLPPSLAGRSLAIRYLSYDRRLNGLPPTQGNHHE